MPILQYLTTTHFDFGDVKVLGDELARLGVKKPLITTDKGVVSAGLIEPSTRAARSGQEE